MQQQNKISRLNFEILDDYLFKICLFIYLYIYKKKYLYKDVLF